MIIQDVIDNCKQAYEFSSYNCPIECLRRGYGCVNHGIAYSFKNKYNLGCGTCQKLDMRKLHDALNGSE